LKLKEWKKRVQVNISLRDLVNHYYLSSLLSIYSEVTGTYMHLYSTSMLKNSEFSTRVGTIVD